MLAGLKHKLSRIECLNGQSGQVLIWALVLLLIGALLTPALLNIATSGLIQGEVLKDRTIQDYLAEAGVETAIWWLTSADHGSDPLPETIGSYKALPLVTEASIDMKRKSYITYLGQFDGLYTYEIKTYAGPDVLDNPNRDSAQVSPYVQIVSDVNFGEGTFDLFGRAVVALDGDIYIANNVEVSSTPDPNEANIIANGDITISNNADIYGNVAVTEDHTISLGNNSYVESTSYGEALSVPTLDTSIYKTEAQAGQVALYGTPVSPSTYNYKTNQTFTIDYANTYYTGNLILGNSETLTFNGNLYVDGYINTGENTAITVNGALYVAGHNTSGYSIIWGNNATITINGALYTNGSVTTGNNNYLILGGTTYVDGSLILQNNNALVGDYTIVARDSITVSNNSSSYAPLFIAEQGDINISNNADISGYFYAPYGTITLSNNTSLTGSVVGQSVDIYNNAEVTFVTTGREGLPGEGASGGLNIVTWEATYH